MVRINIRHWLQPIISRRIVATLSSVCMVVFCIAVSGTLGAYTAQPAIQQQILISTVEDIARDVALAPCKDKERLDAVKALFMKLGAGEAELTVETADDAENLVLRKKGKAGAGTIVIGAHYDKVSDGCGAIDNWTGIVALAHMFRSLKDYPFEKELVFVAFGKEEKGLLGSKAMVKGITNEQVSSYCCMINIDSLGMGSLQILENLSSEPLVKRAVDIAKRANLLLGRASLSSASSDSRSFVLKKIPAITISGLSSGWETILHSGNDQVKRVDVPSVYAGYWFAMAMVVELQALPCDVSRK